MEKQYEDIINNSGLGKGMARAILCQKGLIKSRKEPMDTSIFYPEEQRQKLKDRYHFRKSVGICTSCTSSDLKPGYCQCYECVARCQTNRERKKKV